MAQTVFESYFPEIGIAGFSRHHVGLTYYTLINAIVEPHHVVLDLGAGRGAQFEMEKRRYLRSLIELKGRCRKLIGLDIDPAVLTNPHLDEAHVFDPAKPLPLADQSVDVIYADWVVEHVADPDQFLKEVHRVLKPGGWFCAKTPNKWGLIGLGARLIPNALHTRVLKFVQPDRKEEDVFPVVYRMNTIGSVGKASAGRFENYSFAMGHEIPHLQFSRVLVWLSLFLAKHGPERLAPILLIFMKRKD